MATEKKKTYSDITKEGYQNYKNLQRQNNNVVIDEEENKKAVEEFYKDLAEVEAIRESYTNVAPRKVASPLLRSGQGYLGESKLDRDRIYLPSEFENINEQRAQEQSAAEKILHGTIKGGVLAGTTFLDGTIGLAYGLGKVVQTGKFSQVWDNDVSRFFNNLNEKSEELLPNYYTEDEQINPWSHVFSANFIGDKFIKNLGFTIGALYSGGVYSAGGKALLRGAIGLGKTLKAQKAIATVGEAVNTATGIVTAAFNEGRIEALNNSKEWAKDKIDNANQEHNNALEAIKDAYEGTEVYNDLIAAENKRYDEVMQKIELDRAKMGNMDLLFNMPILIASNAIQFSKLFGNGFKASRLSNNLGVKGSIKSGYTASRNAAKDAVKIANKRFGAEGSEEFGQAIVSNIAGDFYGTDVDNYMKQRYAPEAEQETLNFIKSVSRGVAETFGDEHAWEEFFIGGLTGLLGAPTFRSAKTKNGKWQSPIKFNENIVSELWKAGKERAEAKELVAKLNSTRLNMQDYLKGIIQHNATQAYMDKMAKEGNQREYKNAEFDQMSGHIETFARAGKLEDLKTAIEESAGTTDEDLDALIRNTTVKNEDGTLSGPFSDLAEIDDQGNVVSNLDNEKSKQKLVDQITKNKTRLTNMIDTYKDTMDLYKRLYGDKLSNDQVHELTWMSTKIDNFLDRIESMHSNELRDALRAIKGYYNSALSEIEQELTIEGSKGKGDISEKYKKLEELKKKAERNIFSLDTILLAEGDKKQLFNTISANMKNIDAFIDLINAGTTDEYLSEEEKTKALQALEDIKVLAEDKEKFEKKKNEYIKDPDKMDQDNARTVDEQAEKDKKNKVANHKEAAKNAQDYIAFRDVLDSVQDKEEKDTLIKELEEEKNPHIGTYKEINGYIQAVQAQLDRQPIQEDAKQDVMRILEKRFKAATSLEEAASLDFDTSEHLPYFIEKFKDSYKASEMYSYADYLAKHLLYDANVSEAYKAQFGDKFKVKPESPNNNNNQGNSKQQKDPNVTGADNVSTVPAVNADNNSGTGSKESTSKTESLIVSTPYGNVYEVKEYKNGKLTKHYQVTKDDNGNIVNENYDYYDDIEKNDSSNDNNSNDNLNNDEYQLGDSDDEVPPNGFNDKELSIEGENKGVNDTTNKEEEARDTKPSNVDPFKTEIIPAIPELVPGSNTEPFISKNSNYKEIYEYLVKVGAFEYVNQGNLKLDDEVGFIIKADFQKEVADKKPDVFKEPTIFITHNGKIIGSLFQNKTKIGEYLGLEKLINDIYNEYNANPKNKEQDFVPSQKCLINNLYIGKVNFNEQHKEKSLGDIIGKNNTGNAVLAIVKDNNLFTNGSGIEVRELKSSVGKTGRIYLMLPTGAGIHIPVAVRVKRFGNGSTDFNINNATDAETDLGKLIIKAIKGLVKVRSKDELKLAIAELNKYLYKGKGIHIDFTDSNGKRQLVIKKAKLDSDGNEIYVEKDGNRERDEEVTFITLSEIHDNQEYANDNAYNELVEILQKFNMPIQVSSKHINKGNYNKVLLDSGALTSNLNDTKVRGNWFGIRFKTTDDLKKPSNPINSTDSVVAGEKITIGNETYFVDLSSGEVRDDLGIIMVLDEVKAASILTIAKNYKEGKTEGIVPIYNLDDYTVDLKTGKIEKTDNIRNTDNNINDDDFDALSNDNSNDDGGDTLFREAKIEATFPVFDKSKELEWFRSVLPQLSNSDRLKFVDGLIKIANKDAYAWGQFTKGIITLSDLAAEGTLYHEAFHAVFHLLLDEKERKALTIEAIKRGNIKTEDRKDKDINIDAEEFLADEFMDFVANGGKDNRSLGRKILDFFKSLFVKVIHWSKFVPSSRYYFNAINNGKYANKELNDSIESREREEEYTQEVKDILAKAPRDAKGKLLAPNGKVSNLTERQWLQVRTKAFKRWFGDWEKANTFNIDAIDTSKVDIEEHNKPWKNDLTKSNKTLRIYIKGQREKGYFELVKDQEFGIFSVHFKTGNANTGEIYGSTKEERSILYKQLLNALPNGAQLSTWGELSEGGIKALNKLGKNLKKVGERQVKDRQGNSISIPIYQKGEDVSKVVDENGEPLVVYHGSKDNSFTIFDSTKNNKGQKGFFFTNDSTMASSYGKNPREFFINSRNPYVIEGNNKNWNDLTINVTDIAKDKLDSIRLFKNDLLLQLKERKTSKEIYDYWNNEYFKLYDKYLSLSNSFIDKIKKIVILNRLNKFEGKGNFLKSTRYTEKVLELDNEDTNIIFKSIKDYGPVFNKEANINRINNVAANVYVVTNPNNIKSATDNIGIFSTENDDIRYIEEEYTQEMKDILAKAPKDKDGNLLAPNGKPTNLTKRQWLQVRTKAFKEWFGDWENNSANASKVIDENGEPLVVYHGNKTDNKITAFDLSKKGTEHRERAISGFWFTTDENIAKDIYAIIPESKGRGIEHLKYGEIIPVFLNIKNPVITEQQGIKVSDTPYGKFTIAKERLNNFIDRSKNLETKDTDGYILTMVDSDDRTDDYVSKQTQLVAFDPNQIKSATDNIGTFNKNNDDIRYREVQDNNTVPPIAPTKKDLQEILDSNVNNGYLFSNTSKGRIAKANKLEEIKKNWILRSVRFETRRNKYSKKIEVTEIEYITDLTRYDWRNLTKDQRETLKRKGITEEMWKSLEYDVKKHIIDCIGF